MKDLTSMELYQLKKDELKLLQKQVSFTAEQEDYTNFKRFVTMRELEELRNIDNPNREVKPQIKHFRQIVEKINQIGG